MARARNIKPGFFINPELGELSPQREGLTPPDGMKFAAKLLFEGLWVLADREGRLEDRPSKIRLGVFAADADITNAHVDCFLEALNGEFICRYETDGKRYIQVLNFSRHQKPHSNENASEIPEPTAQQVLSVMRRDQTDSGKLASTSEKIEVLAPKQKALGPDSLTTDSLSTESGKRNVPAEVDDFDIPDRKPFDPFQTESAKAKREGRGEVVPFAPSKTAYRLDEQFVTVMDEYGKYTDLIESDLELAYDHWKFLSMEERVLCLPNIIARGASGLWSDPTKVLRPNRYFKNKEFNRRIREPTVPENATSKQQRWIDQVDSL